jgi:hypothetical protein
MNIRLPFMHSELAPYSTGALFRQVFLILGSMHFCAILLTRCTSIVLNIAISQAGLAGLDGVVEQLPVAAHSQFLKSLFL